MKIGSDLFSLPLPTKKRIQLRDIFKHQGIVWGCHHQNFIRAIDRVTGYARRDLKVWNLSNECSFS